MPVMVIGECEDVVKWSGKCEKRVERRRAMCVGERGNAAESAGILSSLNFVDGVSAGSSVFSLLSAVAHASALYKSS